MLKKLKVYFIIISISLIIFTCMIIFLDRIVGKKLNNLYQGWNHKGYRGEIKLEKKKNFKRIAVFGGSVVGGYGLNYKNSFPYILEQKLASKQFDVVNLGSNGKGIYSILHDVRDYLYLDYDIAIIHNGYNDCSTKGYNLLTRNTNFFYKHFKYLPSLDVYLSEKIQLLLNRKNPNALDDYYKKKAKERAIKYKNDPNKNFNLFTCKNLYEKKNKTLIFDKDEFIDHMNLFYIVNYKKVIDFLTKNKKDIIVIIQPEYGNDPLQKIQSELIVKLIKNYKNVKIINLSKKIDLNNPKISYDRIHNTKLGNELTVNLILSSTTFSN